MYKIQWRPELPNLRCSLCAGGFRLVSQLVPWLANSTLVYLQKRMRGISHSSLLLASSANQILPRFVRFLYIFDMFDNGLGFMDAFWLKRQINWSNALILALVLSLPDSSMGSRVSLPWTAPCWQSSWPKRGNQSLPVMVIIKLEMICNIQGGLFNCPPPKISKYKKNLESSDCPPLKSLSVKLVRKIPTKA